MKMDVVMKWNWRAVMKIRDYMVRASVAIMVTNDRLTSYLSSPPPPPPPPIFISHQSALSFVIVKYSYFVTPCYCRVLGVINIHSTLHSNFLTVHDIETPRWGVASVPCVANCRAIPYLDDPVACGPHVFIGWSTTWMIGADQSCSVLTLSYP